jgi:hypothetical protein
MNKEVSHKDIPGKACRTAAGKAKVARSLPGVKQMAFYHQAAPPSPSWSMPDGYRAQDGNMSEFLPDDQVNPADFFRNHLFHPGIKNNEILFLADGDINNSGKRHGRRQ